MISPSSRAATAIAVISAIDFLSPGCYSHAFVQQAPVPPMVAHASLRMTASSAVPVPSAPSSSSSSSCAAIRNPPPTKTASAVIFDIDGTLANSWRLGYDATAVVLKTNGLGHVEMNEDIYHAHCVYPTPERLARHAGLRPGDVAFESVGADLGRQFDDHYVQLVSLDTCAFYPGVLAALQGLPVATKLGALTNACAAYGHAVIQANCPVKSRAATETTNTNTDGLFALYDRFGTIHGADSVPAPKPSPKGLIQCAEELGLDKHDLGKVLYVGDAVGDGKAARAAGMVSIGVLWGSNSEENLRAAHVFDYICGSVEELRDLLPQA